MYYHHHQGGGGGQDIQSADGLQTLYLMNPNYSGYSSDTNPHPQQQQHGSNMFLFNYPTTTTTGGGGGNTLGGGGHLIGVPLHQTPVSKLTHHHHHHQQQLLEQQHHHDTAAAAGGIPHHHHNFHQNLWGGGGTAVEENHHVVGGEENDVVATQMGRILFHRSGGGGGGGGVVSPTQQGCLSLSLSPQQPAGVYHQHGSLSNFHHNNNNNNNNSNNNNNISIAMHHHQPPPLAGSSSSLSNSGGVVSVINNNNNNNGVSNSIGVQQQQQMTHQHQHHNMVYGSKYLKAAQQLLDELVTVGKGISKSGAAIEDNNNDNNSDNPSTAAADRDNCINKDNSSSKMTTTTTTTTIMISKESGGGGGGGGGETSSSHETKSSHHQEVLSTPQKQEIQMKKAKLITMLDEVEQRYRQYHQQMQIVVASFEQATGIGSARSYTQLALQTISKQFRCLKDAISSQIKVASKSLGEELLILEGNNKMEGSRLKYVDQQLRQQRALQHLGMMQNNAWRPQRGLPERAVSVLRAWLFEHFLHPYPKDSDKQMLAKQTGLTRSQVSNWFINARVRLWKPMVEEMYSEEMKNQEEEEELEGNKIESNKEKTASKKSNTQKDCNNNNNNNKIIDGVVKMDTEISNSSVTLSPSSSSPQGISRNSTTGFGLVCALNMSESNNQQKRLRSSSEIQTSPSSILSMDMEMKFGDTRKGYGGGGGGGTRQQTKENFMTLMAASNNNNGVGGNGFGAFTMGDLSNHHQNQHHHQHHNQHHQFNPNHNHSNGFHGGNGHVSLTLGLPPSENMQHNFFSSSSSSDHQNMDIGSRIDQMEAAAHFERVSNNKQAQSTMGYETIDFENSRKRFAAAPLLPDFVA